ncbi:hypothetical protein [Brevibacillus dissolubilis]|uniref:hypothetical protein n=1 Tax=Brevibacillus dissolubilis TaxID=1844116 RepID=UPI0011164F35|nr:hypothetical protein [Brevibacillus dissolubilis]
MWMQMFFFTILIVVLTLQQITYWWAKGLKRESKVVLGWMVLAWMVGLLFIGGIELPSPVYVIFPEWK